MKLNRFAALLLAVCLLLAACAPGADAPSSLAQTPPVSQPPPASSEAPPPEPVYTPAGRPTVDLADTQALYDTFLRALAISGLAARDWEDPMDLEPDQLVVYGLIELDSRDFPFPREGIPADALEAQVLDRFAVTADHLRRSSYYSRETNRYLTDGYGGAATVEVTGAVQQGDLFTLAYDVSVEGHKVIWGGETVVELTQNGFRHLSNRQWDAEDRSKLTAARFWQTAGWVNAWELTVDDPALLDDIQRMTSPAGMRWLPETPIFPDGGGPLQFTITWEDGKETTGASWARYPDQDGYCAFALEQIKDVQYDYYAQPEARALELVALLKKQGITVTG